MFVASPAINPCVERIAGIFSDCTKCCTDILSRLNKEGRLWSRFHLDACSTMLGNLRVGAKSHGHSSEKTKIDCKLSQIYRSSFVVHRNVCTNRYSGAICLGNLSYDDLVQQRSKNIKEDDKHWGLTGRIDISEQVKDNCMREEHPVNET